MKDAFGFKLGMRLPSRVITLTGNGIASLDDLDPGSIKFVYRKRGVSERVEIPAVVLDAAKRRIRVDFAVVDTDEVAQYEWHVEATAGGASMAWPETGFYAFSVTPTIA